MSVIKRGRAFHLKFRPFGTEVWVSTKAQTKTEAERMEMSILVACRAGDYHSLDPVARECCVRLFRNQGRPLPADLSADDPASNVLTLWNGIGHCLQYPTVRDSSNRERHAQAFVHLVEGWGKGIPVTDITIPMIREYQLARARIGAAASTINKEKAALSAMFRVLIEMGLCDRNPAQMVKGMDERDGRREVYISSEDFRQIVDRLPQWMRPIVQVLYYTGARRGEALGLEWENVNLDSRIIRLHAHQTKERKPKKLPIRCELIPIIQEASRVRSISTNRVFLGDRGKPPSRHSLRKPWTQAVAAVGIDPAPTIHDIRHCWKTNAMRSGMDFEVREAILGHSRGIAGRYGLISDHDLVKAVDAMSFEEGQTEVWVARKQNPAERGLPGLR